MDLVVSYGKTAIEVSETDSVFRQNWSLVVHAKTPGKTSSGELLIIPELYESASYAYRDGRTF